MGLIEFVINNISIFLFYGLLILIFIIFRKNVSTQGKIIFLLRSKFGIKTINWFSNKFREWIKLIGLIGIGIGYSFMLFMIGMLFYLLHLTFKSPVYAAQAAVTPIYPGLNVPGIGVLSFDYFVIAIFIVALIHEFGHAIVAKAHKINVINTGLVLFGPIIGAFVEPDEKQIQKESAVKKYSIFAAGPFFNIILAILALLILTQAINPGLRQLHEGIGAIPQEVINTSASYKAGLRAQDVITKFNKVNILNADDLINQFGCIKPNQSITIQTENKTITFLTTEHPDIPGKGYIGLANGIMTKTKLKANPTFPTLSNYFYNFLMWLRGLFMWIFIISFGVGTFNLLPMSIVDGGQMILTAFREIWPEKKAVKVFNYITFLMLAILLILLGNWLLQKIGIPIFHSIIGFF